MSRVFVRLATCLLTLTAALACGNAEVLASDYEQSCQTDEECTRIYEGDACDCGEDAAINVSDKERYEADWSAAGAFCLIDYNCSAFQAGDDVTQGPACRENTCVLVGRDYSVEAPVVNVP